MLTKAFHFVRVMGPVGLMCESQDSNEVTTTNSAPLSAATSGWCLDMLVMENGHIVANENGKSLRYRG